MAVAELSPNLPATPPSALALPDVVCAELATLGRWARLAEIGAERGARQHAVRVLTVQGRIEQRRVRVGRAVWTEVRVATDLVETGTLPIPDPTLASGAAVILELPPGLVWRTSTRLLRHATMSVTGRTLCGYRAQWIAGDGLAAAGCPRCLENLRWPRTGFARAIWEARLVRGLTERELAERAAVHVTYLHKLEFGTRRPPSLTLVEALAQALGMAADSYERRAFLVAAGFAPVERWSLGLEAMHRGERLMGVSN